MTTETLWQLDAARFARGQAGVIAVLFVCCAAGMTHQLVLVGVGAATVAYARWLPAPFAIALGLVAWAYFTGFVTNRYGELSFTAPDLASLGLLLACAVAAHWRR